MGGSCRGKEGAILAAPDGAAVCAAAPGDPGPGCRDLHGRNPGPLLQRASRCGNQSDSGGQ